MPCDDGDEDLRDEALDYLSTHRYRKMFGISYSQFREDMKSMPYKVYLMDLMIDTMIKQRENKDIKTEKNG